MHPFFEVQAGDPVMSHNGATVRHTRLGSRRSFHEAFAAGYRWFQIDAIPVSDDLLSAHSLTGRRVGWMGRSRDWFRQQAPRRALSSVSEIVLDATGPPGWNAETRWNIEMKNRRGLPHLIAFLEKMKAEGRLGHVLVSSPWRPGVLRAVAARSDFDEVALAAPVQHGGVFGVSWWPWHRPVRPYTCQQVHLWFVRKNRWAEDVPHQQAWTVRSRAALEKLIEDTDPATGKTRWRAWPIVDSRRLTIRPVRANMPRPGPSPHDHQTKADKVEAVALGGGGWRGAFGGIGTIAYLQSQGAWDPNVNQVVGISGGAFAVAGLAGGAPADDPCTALRPLLRDLIAAARRVLTEAIGIGLTVAVAVAGSCVAIGSVGGGTALAAAVVPLLAATLFLTRALLMYRWRRLAGRIFGSRTMASNSDATRRFAIGATGLNDGNLYSFSTSADRERTRMSQARWPAPGTPPPVVEPQRAIPLSGWRLTEAVVRASSLPGIGPRAGRKIWLPCPEDHQHDDGHTAACEWVPDRLVDGGLAGIFGRGLLLRPDELQIVRAGPQVSPLQELGTIPNEQTESVPRRPMLLTVDTGRALVPNDAETLLDRLLWWAQRVSAIVLEARWLQVAFNISYLAEMAVVYDGAEVDDFELRLVRLAETETDAWPDPCVDQAKRDLLQERLYVLRDKVHKLSLLKARADKAHDAVACAAAACALDCEPVPRLDDPDEVDGRRGILQEVEMSLGLEDVLVERWRSLKVPMLGQP